MVEFLCFFFSFSPQIIDNNFFLHPQNPHLKGMFTWLLAGVLENHRTRTNACFTSKLHQRGYPVVLRHSIVSTYTFPIMRTHHKRPCWYRAQYHHMDDNLVCPPFRVVQFYRTPYSNVRHTILTMLNKQISSVKIGISKRSHHRCAPTTWTVHVGVRTIVPKSPNIKEQMPARGKSRNSLH